MKSVTWAVDPYSKVSPSKNSLQILKGIFHGNTKKINPVFVTAVQQKSRLKNIANDVNAYISEIHKENHLGRLDILSCKDRSQEKKINRLLSHAKKNKSEVIALSSHGRSGWKRYILGSFAEGLLKKSTIPVLFMAKAKNKGDDFLHQKVLFATDFSEESKKSYLAFLKFAQKFSYQVILYHLVTDKYIAPPAAAAVAAGTVDYYTVEFFEEQKKWAKQKAQEWVKLTQKKFPKCEVRAIIQKSSTEIAPSIIDIAKEEEVALVGLSSYDGILKKTLFGSVAEEVFRRGSIPVWVTGPAFKNK